MMGAFGVVTGVALVAVAFVIARLLGIPTGGRTATVKPTNPGPFKLPESVVYRDYFEAERYKEDFAVARLQCTPAALG